MGIAYLKPWDDGPHEEMEHAEHRIQHRLQAHTHTYIHHILTLTPTNGTIIQVIILATCARMLMMESLEAIAVECMWRIWYAVNAT